jgi:uncharacterized phage protein (TIGR01671 family)
VINYDRLLTRVFDKQEKKMLYQGDKFSFIDTKNYGYRFVGVGAEGLVVTHGQDDRYMTIIPFDDRFIPMQCLGLPDKNKKLIYESDIVATSNNKYLVYQDEEAASFWFKRLDNECEILINDFGCEIEIIGNRWENEKLLEVKV